MSDGTDEARGERLTRGLRLYVISDDDLALELTHEDVLEVAIASGATAVELAVPIARTADLVRRGQPLRAMARERGVLFFVLNDVDAAAGLEADGVFLNRGDLAVRDARKLLGRWPYIGVPVRTPDRARRAEAEGADFVRLGPVGDEGRARGGRCFGLNQVATVAGMLQVPVLAWELAPSVPVEDAFATGIAGISVREQVVGAEDMEAASLRLRALVERCLAARLEGSMGAGTLRRR